MPRGGYRENAGRKSEWNSCSKTVPIRVPETLVDTILEIARKLDKGEALEIEQNQSSGASTDSKLDEVRKAVDKWQSKAETAAANSTHYRNVRLMIADIMDILNSELGGIDS